ncbi:anti-sigma factor [Acidihalobacter ferrooxydans]|uniref:Anti-sigma K factor RskA C-terminal domain-containing protein n=1 Tax=Acidihalobacter ferrooxydans TaxID=1765967 RepID=A0A1P8UET4_9GAMM|nr:anti-sigma factor [Acidihalobacter ferrooxydans]APZ42362.1 hypothetical protein BW247_04035 [Acidihalobacter ferrooxydans]
MDWSNERRRDALAADYVLGLLQGRALARFERRMQEDTDLQRRVWALRERLDPLLQGEPREPSAAVWQRIEQELGWAPKRRPWAWFERLSLAAAVFALVAAIGLGVYVQTRPSTPPSGRMLAVLHNTDKRQVLRVNLAADGRGVTVVALHPLTVPKGRSLELWALPKKGAPIAVGLLNPKPGQIQHYPLHAAVAELGGFAVSVEPPGGSPKPVPTGPIVYQGVAIS